VKITKTRNENCAVKWKIENGKIVLKWRFAAKLKIIFTEAVAYQSRNELFFEIKV